MIQGVIFSIIAGLMVSMQGVLNARVSEKVGFWFTNAFVHGSGFLLAAFIFMIAVRKVDLSQVKSFNSIYLMGGFMGVVVVFSAMKGISNLGATYSIMILLITQIVVTFAINYFGLFGESIIVISPVKIIGILLIIIGIVLFQLF